MYFYLTRQLGSILCRGEGRLPWRRGDQQRRW